MSAGLPGPKGLITATKEPLIQSRFIDHVFGFVKNNLTIVMGQTQFFHFSKPTDKGRINFSQLLLFS